MARTPKPRDRGQESARGGRKRPAKAAAKAVPRTERPLAFEPVPDDEPVEEEAAAEVVSAAQDAESAEGAEKVRAVRSAEGPDVVAVRPVRRQRPPGERRYLVQELFD
jgi:hypothetical protein